ncbi:hypothetical protein [Sphingomonas turrisvirgatae]|uniref:Uncharacterized protein n=1 Tax=Sphingomonas turrisvirgatae TaxID=1888892 RepID=A0A1E3LYW5_9SPHN|nr:hypothetical protein [Sphingomonas turrisvirgatae]ODP38976.1 hypothetical protein BFL28_12285 [Sphingomonas turrisvirgatae]
MARLAPSVFLALSIVEAARLAAKANGRMPRTRALRLALAHLFQHAGGDRAPYDAFWACYARDYPELWRPIDSQYRRNTELAEAWVAILRSLDLRDSPQLAERLGAFDVWQAREEKALLQGAIRENRRIREFAKDARECHSPNGQNLPRLIPAKHN